MSASPASTGHWARRVGFWLAACVALLVAHDAVVLVQTGPGRAAATALRSGGHEYWPVASWLIVAAGSAGAAWWGWRLVRLSHLAPEADASARPPAAPQSWPARTLRIWPRLFAVVALVFLGQENVEHAAAHGHLIGLAALIGPEYPLALPVLAAVSGVVACLAALVRHHEAELIRRVTTSRLAVSEPDIDRRSTRTEPRSSAARGPLARRGAERAPPIASLLTANA